MIVPLSGIDDVLALIKASPSSRARLDQVTRLIGRFLNAPVARINILLKDRQVTISSYADSDHAEWLGLYDDVPIDESICKFAVRDQAPLILSDAKNDPRVSETPLVEKAGIANYAGVPLQVQFPDVIGCALCVMGFEERKWNDSDIEMLKLVGEINAHEVVGNVLAGVEHVQLMDALQRVTDVSSSLTVVTDERLHVRYSSPAARGVFGLEPTSMVGVDLTELLHRDDQEKFRDQVRRLQLENRELSGIYRVAGEGGREVWVVGTGSDLRSSQNIQGFVFDFQDVTEVRKMQSQKRAGQRMEALGALSAGVAHDFMNVLGVVELSTQMVGLKEIDAESRVDLNAISEAVQRGVGLAEQLMEFGRSYKEEEDVSTRIDECAKRILPLLDRLAGPKVSVTLDCSIDDVTVPVPESQIEQILMNLVGNGRDAIDGQGKIMIVLDRSEDREQIVLLVADTGPGIPEELVAKVFQPYFTTKGDRGTGLGLSTVWRIVNEAAGSISIEPRPGGGTQVRIVMPVLRPEPTLSAQHGAPRSS